jgi:hypothetical protein
LNGCKRVAIQSAFSTASLALTSSQPTRQLCRHFELYDEVGHAFTGSVSLATTMAVD